MSLKEFIKERILIHHTEKDLIKVSIVKGKDHCHLELTDGDITMEKRFDDLKEAIREGIKFLNKSYR